MMVRQTPAYAPLVGCAKFSVVGALPVGEGRFRCRARVWPAEGVAVPYGVRMPALGVRYEAPVLDYDWELSQQPEGSGDTTSGDATVAGCWMVDGVLPDASPREVWDGSDPDGNA